MSTKSKKAVIELKGDYYDFVERYSEKRDLSFAAAVKQLLLLKIDEVEAEEKVSKDIINAVKKAMNSDIDASIDVEKETPTPKNKDIGKKFQQLRK